MTKEKEEDHVCLIVWTLVMYIVFVLSEIIIVAGITFNFKGLIIFGFFALFLFLALGITIQVLAIKDLGKEFNKKVYWTYTVGLFIFAILEMLLIFFSETFVSKIDYFQIIQLTWTILGVCVTLLIFLSGKIILSNNVVIPKSQLIFSFIPVFIDLIILSIGTFLCLFYKDSLDNIKFYFISFSFLLTIVNAAVFTLYSIQLISSLRKETNSK